MKLKTQSTNMPTRKMAAVIISGAVIGAAQAALSIFWPDHPFVPMIGQIDVWVQAIVMIAAGYIVRDKE